MDSINILDNTDGGEDLEPSPKFDGFQIVEWGRANQPTLSPTIYCHSKVISEIENHAKGDHREVGGILLGNIFVNKDRLVVEISEYIPAPVILNPSGKEILSSVAHFTFSPEIWAGMLRRKDKDFDDLRVVGWFHSHPGHGIFLSSWDLSIHQNHFKQPWHIALVYDPKRNIGGFFIRSGTDIIETTGFFLLQKKGSPSLAWNKRSDFVSRTAAEEVKVHEKQKQVHVNKASLILPYMVLTSLLITSLFAIFFATDLFVTDPQATKALILEVDTANKIYYLESTIETITQTTETNKSDLSTEPVSPTETTLPIPESNKSDLNLDDGLVCAIRPFPGRGLVYLFSSFSSDYAKYGASENHYFSNCDLSDEISSCASYTTIPDNNRIQPEWWIELPFSADLTKDTCHNEGGILVNK